MSRLTSTWKSAFDGTTVSTSETSLAMFCLYSRCSRACLCYSNSLLAPFTALRLFVSNALCFSTSDSRISSCERGMCLTMWILLASSAFAFISYSVGCLSASFLASNWRLLLAPLLGRDDPEPAPPWLEILPPFSIWILNWSC